jgi:hypothetical protein
MNTQPSSKALRILKDCDHIYETQNWGARKGRIELVPE